MTELKNPCTERTSRPLRSADTWRRIVSGHSSVQLTKVDKRAVFGQNGGVEKSLNLPALRDAHIKAGPNQPELAAGLTISPEALCALYGLPLQKR